MHALVDGHNAIFRLGLTGATPEAVRRTLLGRVARVSTDATVFFDARGASLLAPSVEREAGLEVRYCRGGEADEGILDAVRAARRPAELLVVSDDRELCGRARQLGATTLGVEAFLGQPTDSGEREGRAPEEHRGGRALSAADFGLPPVIDLGDASGWLRGAEAPPEPPATPSPAAKADDLARRLEAARPVRHVLLCAEPTKPKCAAAEIGRATWEHLKQRVRDLGLDAVKPPAAGPAAACVLRTKVDCLRVCADGPIAVVYPDGTWYRGVTVPVMERILQEHVLGGRVVTEHVLARVPLAPR